MRTLLLTVLLVCTTLISSAFAQSQITTGVIQGVVTDATGATVPGVTVEARNLSTNQSRTVVTESDGRFVFLQLPSATYRVTYTLPGFTTLVQENIGRITRGAAAAHSRPRTKAVNATSTVVTTK